MARSVLLEAIYQSANRLQQKNLRDSGSVYTPQVIIGGREQAAGGHEARIDNAIKRARVPYDVAFDTTNRQIQASRGQEHLGRADIYVVLYQNTAITHVTAGENNEKTLQNTNIVRDLRLVSLGDTIPEYDSASGKCAIFAQSWKTGAIIGLSHC